MSLRKIAILGPGLLGGSLALAVQERKLSGEISLYARNLKVRDAVKEAGLNADVTDQPAVAVKNADIVILCVPVCHMAALIGAALPGLSAETVITDVGSVKGPVVAELEPLLKGRARWIGSHPMAGSEQAGFSAARASLFQDAVTILTPTPDTDPAAEALVAKLWEDVGSRILRLSPGDHDRLVAQVSHLPHLVAAALVSSASPESLPLAGNGFRDTTRIAAGSPDLWTDILLTNRESVSAALATLIATLEETRRHLADGDEKGLHDLLSHANHIRSPMTNRRPA